MFEIVLTSEAIDDMRSLRKFERQHIFDEIEEQLQHQPIAETRNRKRLHPNNLAEWELRIGKFRVFYDVDEIELRVKIEAVGYKNGSVLIVHGEEYEL
jgi:mRNA-degrading endonuclease RelE of RelBE toxin-antitoxin system